MHEHWQLWLDESWSAVVFWLQPLVILFHHQESLERCAAAAWSCRARRRFAWPSRRWKEVTRTNRGGTSLLRRQSWDSLTIPTSSGWRGWWRAVSTPVTPHWRYTSTNLFSKIYQNGTLGVTMWFRSKIKLKFRRLRSLLSKQNLYCVFALAFKRSLNLIWEKPLPILDLQMSLTNGSKVADTSVQGCRSFIEFPRRKSLQINDLWSKPVSKASIDP